MAKNQNTFEKRRREFEKRQKAEEKRKRREERKRQTGSEVIASSRQADDDAEE